MICELEDIKEGRHFRIPNSNGGWSKDIYIVQAEGFVMRVIKNLRTGRILSRYKGLRVKPVEGCIRKSLRKERERKA